MAQGALYGGYPLYPLRPKGGMWAPTGKRDKDGNPTAMVVHWCGIFAT
jgi:hypothetical protein